MPGKIAQSLNAGRVIKPMKDGAQQINVWSLIAIGADSSGLPA